MRMGAHLELAALVASCVPCSAANRAIDLCISRFDEDTKAAFLDLYSKIDADPQVFNKPEVEEVSDQPEDLQDEFES